MKAQRIWAILETVLFTLAIALALGVAFLAGTLAHNGWLQAPHWWACVVKVWGIPNAAGDWLGAHALFISIALTSFFSAVAVALRTGLPRSRKSKGWAWTIVVAMDFIVLALYVRMLISAVGDLPAQCY